MVTGGASGIGRAIAAALCERNCRVVVADRDEAALNRTCKGLEVIGVPTDVSDPESVHNLARAARDHLGTIDLVFNNAGVGPMAPISSLTTADWQWILGVNLWGVIHGVQAFLPILRENPLDGRIVNTASVAGLRAGIGLGAYSVSKYGVVALSEALALELAAEGSRIGVTAFCPGPVDTNIGSSTRSRPAGLSDGALADVDLHTVLGNRTWISPARAAELLLAAIAEDQLYAVTHPSDIENRHHRIERAFRAAADRAG